MHDPAHLGRGRTAEKIFRARHVDVPQLAAMAQAEAINPGDV